MCHFEHTALAFTLFQHLFARRISHVLTENDNALVYCHFVLQTRIQQIDHGFVRLAPETVLLRVEATGRIDLVRINVIKDLIRGGGFRRQRCGCCFRNCRINLCLNGLPLPAFQSFDQAAIFPSR